jgi:hypothetical protein
MVNDQAPALERWWSQLQYPGIPMSLSFLIGAIIGSGAFILLGRAPAQKLVEAVQARIGKPR